MSTQERVEQIRNLATQLSEAEQEAFRKAMERQVMMAEAQQLSKGTKATITLEEIVKEVNVVREERYQRGK